MTDLLLVIICIELALVIDTLGMRTPPHLYAKTYRYIARIIEARKYK